MATHVVHSCGFVHIYDNQLLCGRCMLARSGTQEASMLCDMVCVCVRCCWHSLCLCQLLPQLLLAAQVLQAGVLHTGRQTVRAATAAADTVWP